MPDYKVIRTIKLTQRITASSKKEAVDTFMELDTTPRVVKTQAVKLV